MNIKLNEGCAWTDDLVALPLLRLVICSNKVKDFPV